MNSELLSKLCSLVNNAYLTGRYESIGDTMTDEYYYSDKIRTTILKMACDIDEPTSSPLKGRTKIPPEFQVTPAMREWYAKQDDFVLGIEESTSQWVDHFRSNGKKMRDWTAAWRNGMRCQNKWAKEKMGNIDHPKKIGPEDDIYA